MKGSEGRRGHEREGRMVEGDEEEEGEGGRRGEVEGRTHTSHDLVSDSAQPTRTYRDHEIFELVGSSSYESC